MQGACPGPGQSCKVVAVVLDTVPTLCSLPWFPSSINSSLRPGALKIICCKKFSLHPQCPDVLDKYFITRTQLLIVLIFLKIFVFSEKKMNL